MKVKNRDQEFIVIGENIHCTRVLLRKGKRVGESPNGEPAVLFPGDNGESQFLPVPEKVQKGNDFKEGRVKHVQSAVLSAMDKDSPNRQTGLDYIRHLIERQANAGADFLDLNVDEISYSHDDQQDAMRWLVTTVQEMTDKPLSIDSSLIHTIEAGLKTYRNIAGRPLLNSASLERVEALDLAKQYEAHVVITGAGESGMPENAEQRIANATKMVDIALDKGISISDIQVDLLVFPISVDSSFGQHYLDAVREIRTKYGPDIHITGGMSNVSFGIPCRSLVNDVFVDLAVDAGADGGIIDPVTRNIDEILNMDRSTKPYGLAKDMLLGQDRNCKNFLRAFRQGELA